MPLISCPECGREVSSKATACPRCAHPMGGAQVVEQTAKLWKVIQLCGATVTTLAMAAVILLWLIKETLPIIAIAVLSVGVLVWMTGRIGAWWYHG